MDYYAIGQRVKRFRRARGLSQEALAEQVGISTTHMSHIETGSTKLSLQVFAALAQALQVSADALLFGDNTQTETAQLAQCTPAQARALQELLAAAKNAAKLLP